MCWELGLGSSSNMVGRSSSFAHDGNLYLVFGFQKSFSSPRHVMSYRWRPGRFEPGRRQRLNKVLPRLLLPGLRRPITRGGIRILIFRW
jgi:hypothetical protein